MSVTSRRFSATPALLVAFICFAVISAALILEHGYGYAPCPLCLKQRWPYYIGVPVAFFIALTGHRLPKKLVVLTMIGLAALFVYGAYMAVYQAGAEWRLWAGPTDCAVGSGDALPKDVSGFIDAVGNSVVVSCTDPSLRIFHLSLAAWNAAVMIVSAIISLFGAWQSAKK